MNDIILQILSLKKCFNEIILPASKNLPDVPHSIIDDLNLNIPRNCVMALIGGNAVGKTTLFNIISGFLKPTSGEILYKTGGIPVSLVGKKPHQIARLGIGRLFQDDHIFPNMTILENMIVSGSARKNISSFFPFPSPRREKKEKFTLIDKARAIFEDLFGARNEFWNQRNRPAGILSFGQQRLLAVARLFMSSYDLILMDEPTSGIHPEYAEKVIVITRRLVSKRMATVFLIEHNMEVVLKIADFCSFMSQGKIAAIGTPEDVIGNDEVRKTYLGI